MRQGCPCCAGCVRNKLSFQWPDGHKGNLQATIAKMNPITSDTDGSDCDEQKRITPATDQLTSPPLESQTCLPSVLRHHPTTRSTPTTHTESGPCALAAYMEATRADTQPLSAVLCTVSAGHVRYAVTLTLTTVMADSQCLSRLSWQKLILDSCLDNSLYRALLARRVRTTRHRTWDPVCGLEMVYCCDRI